jgi:hypothetical protein
VNDITEIYVRLLGEAIDVWRPVEAENLYDQVYKIIDQTYDREAEKWQFEPGEAVACESKELSDGVVLVAVRRQE